jgi:chaperonin GroEL
MRKLKIILGSLLTSQKVVSTLGKFGNYVFIKDPQPFFTLDGVTVANSVNFKNKFLQLGADIIKSVANKTNKEVGDGTTTTVLLTSTLMLWTYILSFFVNQKSIRRNLLLALDSLSLKPIQGHLENVATTSCRDAELGKAIADIYEKAGTNVGFSFKEGGEGVSFQVNSGTFLPYGTKPSFLKGKKYIANDLLVYVSEQTVTSNKEILPVLEKKKPVLFVTKKLSGQALDTLVLNMQKGTVDVCVIDCEDPILYKLIGATKDNNTFEAESCVVDKERAFIKFKDTTAIDNYAQNVENEEDIARLSGTIVDVFVGADTPQKAQEIIHRLEDATNATRNAILYGVVRGGGQDLADTEFEVEKNLSGLLTAFAFRRMLTAPYRRLGGGDVYDPYKTQITAVHNAVGVSELLLNTKHVI